MRIRSVVFVTAALLALGIMTAVRAEEGGKQEKETEVKVALADLPAAVKEAAEKAVPGIVLTEAEKIMKGAEVVCYEVEGKAGGKEYEIKVSPDGKVLKVEQEKDDDEDDGKDDDDGEEDDD